MYIKHLVRKFAVLRLYWCSSSVLVSSVWTKTSAASEREFTCSSSGGFSVDPNTNRKRFLRHQLNLVTETSI